MDISMAIGLVSFLTVSYFLADRHSVARMYYIAILLPVLLSVHRLPWQKLCNDMAFRLLLAFSGYMAVTVFWGEKDWGDMKYPLYGVVFSLSIIQVIRSRIIGWRQLYWVATFAASLYCIYLLCNYREFNIAGRMVGIGMFANPIMFGILCFQFALFGIIDISSIGWPRKAKGDSLQPEQQGKCKSDSPIFDESLALIEEVNPAYTKNFFQGRGVGQFLVRGLAIIPLLACGYLANSRGPSLAFGISLLAYIAFRLWRRKVLFSCFLGLSLAIAAGVWHMQNSDDGGEKSVEKVVSHRLVEKGLDAEARIKVWKATLDIFPRHLMMGGGIDRKWSLANCDHPHNLFLGIALRGGLVGLLLFLSLLLLVLFRSRKFSHVLFVVLCVLIHCLTDEYRFFTRPDRVWFYLMFPLFILMAEAFKLQEETNNARVQRGITATRPFHLRYFPQWLQLSAVCCLALGCIFKAAKNWNIEPIYMTVGRKVTDYCTANGAEQPLFITYDHRVGQVCKMRNTERFVADAITPSLLLSKMKAAGEQDHGVLMLLPWEEKQISSMLNMALDQKIYRGRYHPIEFVGGDSITLWYLPPLKGQADLVVSDDFKGEQDSIEKTWSGKYFEGDGSIIINGRQAVTSNEPLAIKADACYRLRGRFRSKAPSESKLYLGFIPLNGNKEQILRQSIHPCGKQTVLVKACEAESKVLYVKDASDWWESPYALVAFNADMTGGFSDLPNLDLSSLGVTKVERLEKSSRRNINDQVTSADPQLHEAFAVSLSNPCGKTYPAGTAVRQHRSGGTYMYTAAAGEPVPDEWTEFSGIVYGRSKYWVSDNFLWPGTEYVRIVILANWDSPENAKDQVLEVDWIRLEIFEPQG